jgi:hypothetical protein
MVRQRGALRPRASFGAVMERRIQEVEMIRLAALAALVAAATFAAPAAADADEEGVEKFRDGPCKVEREWKKDGEHQENVVCEKRPRRSRAFSAVAIRLDRARTAPEGYYGD